MKLAKRHKLYIVILGLVLVGMLATGDSSEEQSASSRAKKSPKTKKTDSRKDKQAKNLSPASIDTHLPPPCDALAGRLKEVCSDRGVQMTEIRGVFGATREWFPGSRGEGPKESVAEIVMRFKEKYRLKATIVAPDGGRAVINDVCLTVGEELDGFKLISVSRAAAVLESDAMRIVLELELPEEISDYE